MYYEAYDEAVHNLLMNHENTVWYKISLSLES